MRSLLGTVLALMLGAGTVPTVAAGADDIVAQSIGGTAAIVLDGELEDAAWLRAVLVTTFVQRDPLEGASPTFRTEARVVYDASAIYVAVRAFDAEPERIAGFLTRRDADSASDWIQVFIDSYHDKRTAYQFGVNPLGVKQDSYWFNDDNNDDSWDAVWEVLVKRNAEGWQAEFRIPFSQLRFAGKGDGQLGFAITRNVARLNETSTWPLLSKSASGWVSSFGTLTGVNVGSASKRLELIPYSVAQVLTAPRQAGNPLQKTTDPGASFGADLKYAVTPALTLTATVNPDFGQVEADPAVVNLSAFETFFQEKRPFFIEGSGTYQFDCRDCSLFYSRRIGRTPRGSPVLDEGGYAAAPVNSTILGAAKLTGRVRDFSVGVLTAATDAEEARVAFGGQRWTEIVEPRTFYSVSRARREFSDQSSLGFMLTTTSRQLVESVSFLPDSAVTGGVDYNWRMGKRWGLNGYWSGSRITGSTESIGLLQQNNVHSFQRPDAEHVEFDPLADSLRGHSGNVNFAKIAGERTRLNFSLGYRSPGFEVNDLGFQQRADEIPQNSWFQIRWNTPGKFARSKNINFNQWSSHNFDGDRLSLGGNVNSHWQFQNLWNIGGGINVNAQNFDDRLTRGGPGGYGRANINGWQYFNTDDRRLVSLYWNSGFYFDGRGRNVNIGPGIVLRPTAAFSVELGTYYEKRLDDAQWVEAVTSADRTHYVFGRLDQKTSSITTRVNYTITPNLSVQVYAQPFVSSGRYEDFRELVNGRAAGYDDRYAPFAYESRPDFKVLSFRTTNVMRWEYKPGSTLFVVWQQGREGLGAPRAFHVGRDYADIFSTPSSNALLVKLAYWLNP
ncbi:MAG TPA: DUF5916 domain-containing protein [Vicinamibacterales bacterium]|nr:DUF5916 domain-containing protein [Vicinamibacterales bacterium]